MAVNFNYSIKSGWRKSSALRHRAEEMLQRHGATYMMCRQFLMVVAAFVCAIAGDCYPNHRQTTPLLLVWLYCGSILIIFLLVINIHCKQKNERQSQHQRWGFTIGFPLRLSYCDYPNGSWGAFGLFIVFSHLLVSNKDCSSTSNVTTLEKQLQS